MEFKNTRCLKLLFKLSKISSLFKHRFLFSLKHGMIVSYLVYQHHPFTIYTHTYTHAHVIYVCAWMYMQIYIYIYIYIYIKHYGALRYNKKVTVFFSKAISDGTKKQNDALSTCLSSFLMLSASTDLVWTWQLIYGFSNL